MSGIRHRSPECREFPRSRRRSFPERFDCSHDFLIGSMSIEAEYSDEPLTERDR
jgi:hypothetical protein